MIRTAGSKSSARAPASVGLFIVFEGPEGSGKSTQARRLEDSLRGTGVEVIRTREPGGTTIGEQVRSLLLDPERTDMLPLTEALLYAASRAQLVGEVIEPALRRGAIVISDRFVDSSLAYQVGGRGLPAAEVTTLQRIATGGLAPHLRILLDLPVTVGLARRYRAASEVNRLDAAERDFHDRVAAFYHRLVAANPEAWLRLDAERPLDDLAEAILTAVRSRISDTERAAIISEEA